MSVTATFLGDINICIHQALVIIVALSMVKVKISTLGVLPIQPHISLTGEAALVVLRGNIMDYALYTRI